MEVFRINVLEIKNFVWKNDKDENYHVYGARNLNNEDAHEQMAKDTMFHEWIQKTFGCSPGEAECLAYVEMENTSAYDNLPKEKKEAIASCEKKYNIKIE